VTSTPGIRPAALLGMAAAKSAVARTRVASNGLKATPTAAAPEGASIEIIRGDKRAHEIVRQEQ